MRIIGITGGVGSGKSHVLSHMQERYGATICQADHVAWELQSPGTRCHQKIVECFGTDILQEDGSIHRGTLGAIVFADHARLQQLNEIMHPEVKEAIVARIAEAKESGASLFIIEAALLLEDGYDTICDEIWYIYTKESVRRERLKMSRAYSDEKIDGILSAQSSEAYFRSRCETIIDNSNAFADTCEQIQKALYDEENTR